MNFKTTLVLLGVLLGLGLVLFWSSRTENLKPETTQKDDARERRVFADVKSEDVNKITVIPADGKRMVMQKEAGKWKLIEPVAAAAETFEVDALARELAELKAHGRVTESADATATGLASPRYRVEFSTSGNKTFMLNVGNKSAVGDNLYVTVGDSKQADVVGGELLERLEKPASTYRDPKLVNLTSSEVKQVTIVRGSEKIRIEKAGEQWKVVEPTSMRKRANSGRWSSPRQCRPSRRKWMMW
jgi:hypothetical protein